MWTDAKVARPSGRATFSPTVLKVSVFKTSVFKTSVSRSCCAYIACNSAQTAWTEFGTSPRSATSRMLVASRSSVMAVPT